MQPLHARAPEPVGRARTTPAAHPTHTPVSARGADCSERATSPPRTELPAMGLAQVAAEAAMRGAELRKQAEAMGEAQSKLKTYFSEDAKASVDEIYSRWAVRARVS